MTVFDKVVASSRRLRPGVLAGEMQLAEMYNGVSCETEIRDWRELVGIAVTNGVRMMDYFNLRTTNSRYQLAAEERMEYVRRGVMRRFVMDVMIGDEAGVTVIDWKTHSITKTDIRQVEGYQEYLLDVGLARPTRVYGFAVDLLHEEVQECHYRKIQHTFTASSASVGMRSINPKNDSSRGEMGPTQHDRLSTLVQFVRSLRCARVRFFP